MITTAKRILFCKATNLTEFLSWFGVKEWDFWLYTIRCNDSCIISLGGGALEAHNPGKLWKKYSSLNIYYFILRVWEIPCHWSMVNMWASATVNEYTGWCNRGAAWDFPLLEIGWSTKGKRAYIESDKIIKEIGFNHSSSLLSQIQQF